MRRVVAVCLCAILALSLASCGSSVTEIVVVAQPNSTDMSDMSAADRLLYMFRFGLPRVDDVIEVEGLDAPSSDEEAAEIAEEAVNAAEPQ